MRTALIASTLVMFAFGATPMPASAKKKPAAKPAEAEPPKIIDNPETQKAVDKLMGVFKWGMSPEDALKIIIGDIETKYAEKIQKAGDAFKQDAVRREMTKAIDKAKDGYVKFNGQHTGWDVSLVDKEFSHGNDESMVVMWEKDQRRFLFFHNDKLWKQFIAFNADHPKFAGKSFDDFADIIQKVYGPASVTFRKQRSTDEQTFDHLEWMLPGDNQLWAVDMTTLYNNYCLSLMQRSVLAQVEKGRKEKGPQRSAAAANLVNQVTRPSEAAGDANVDVVDEITGRTSQRTNQGIKQEEDKGGKRKGAKGGKAADPQ